MKIYVKSVLLLAIFVIGSFITMNTAFAAIIDTVTIVGDQGFTTVKGSLASYSNQQIVSIYLLNKGKTKSDIANMTDPNLVFKHIGMTMIDGNGTYSYSFSASDASAENLLYIKSESAVATIPFGEYIFGENVLFVSPTGNDNAIGDITHPLATLNGAKNKVRTLRSSLGSDAAIAVSFLPGEYRLTQSVEFSSIDSGSVSAPVIYRAYNGGNVTFKGSVMLPINNLSVVNDVNILRRLPVSSVGKVYSMNLASQGISSNQVIFKDDQDRDVSIFTGAPASLGLYVNQKRQNIARWPNYSYNKFYLSDGTTSSIVSNGNETTGAVFKYDTVNPSRWTEANSMFIDGYLETQYRGVWRTVSQIDTAQKTISLKYGAVNSPSRRWTAVNLLEEIDAPGEFYIDKATMMLYYYPAYSLDSGRDVLEYATMQTPLVKFTKVSNVILKGLSFTQAYSQGIWGKENTGIVIDGCTISDVRPFGISFTESKNTTIKNCTIFNIAGEGIRLNSNAPESDTLQLNYCNNRVINNHIYNIGMDIRNMCTGISCDGVGTEIRNNLIHLGSNSAVANGGAENIFSYNEMYNLIRDSADAGGIYIGRRWNLYGVKYEFNYLHDFGMEGFIENEHTSGIFWDDTLSGQNATNNIIVNNYEGKAYGINSNGGRDLKAKYNVFVGSDYPIRVVDFSNNNTTIPNSQTLVDALKRVVDSNSVYSLKYPQMTATYREITDPTYAEYNGKFNPKNNEFTSNVFALSKRIDSSNGVYVNGRMKTEFASTVLTTPNYISQSNNIFVDAAHQDFRISDAGKTTMGINDSKFMLDQSFDINSIGLQVNAVSGLSNSVSLGDEFKKTYPKNSTTTYKPDSVELAWEQGLFADEYEYVVSGNSDLSNPVATGTTIFKYAKVQGLTPGRTYYWNVTAKHTSRKYSLEEYNGGKWGSAGGVYSFITSPYKIYLNDLLAVRGPQNVNIQMNINNIENSDKNSIVIMACYSQNGNLKSLNRVPVTVPAMCKDRKVEFSFSCNYLSTDYFTAFIWNNLDGIMPLVNDKIYAR